MECSFAMKGEKGAGEGDRLLLAQFGGKLIGIGRQFSMSQKTDLTPSAGHFLPRQMAKLALISDGPNHQETGIPVEQGKIIWPQL